MLTHPVNTLSYHSSRVLCTSRDMSNVPCANLAASIKEYLKSHGTHGNAPEKSALCFYGMNHGMFTLGQRYHPLEPMHDADVSFVNKYHSVNGKEAVRAFYYLLLICVRESRHVHTSSYLDERVTAKFGEACSYFNQSISKNSSTQAYERFLDTPPNVSLGAFVNSLVYIFYEGGFGNGYGGPKWGAIADCLSAFVHGHYTPEMMLDTNWTLCHNGGPIFNKQMLYEDYSVALLRILDVQRGGQIPEMVLTDSSIGHYVPSGLQSLLLKLRERHPGAFGDYIDWYKVEALGALHDYGYDKIMQVKMHGLQPEQLVLLDKFEQAKHAGQIAKVAALANFKKTHFEYFPGQYVKIVERAA